MGICTWAGLARGKQAGECKKARSDYRKQLVFSTFELESDGMRINWRRLRLLQWLVARCRQHWFGWSRKILRFGTRGIQSWYSFNDSIGYEENQR